MAAPIPSRSQTCEQAGYAGPADAKFQSCDVVQIELAPGWGTGDAQLVAAHCANDQSKQVRAQLDACLSLSACLCLCGCCLCLCVSLSLSRQKDVTSLTKRCHISPPCRSGSPPLPSPMPLSHLLECASYHLPDIAVTLPYPRDSDACDDAV